MTAAAPPVLPFSHFTNRRGGGRMFNLTDCEKCGGDCQAPNGASIGTNQPRKLRRLGLVELEMAPSELGWSDPLGMAVCPLCYATAQAAADNDADRFDGSAAVATLEAVWAVIQTHNADAPRVVFLLGGGSDKQGELTWGHWWAGRWRVDGGERIGEVMIAGERLAMGAEWVLSTLLHECAHALAFVREIKDTSRRGRYHNGRFQTLAREVGLDCEQGEGKNKARGFTRTSLTDPTRALYAAELRRLEAICERGHRVRRSFAGQKGRAAKPPEGGDGGDGDEGKQTDGKRITLLCGCEKPRRIRVVRSVAELGTIGCELCLHPFAEVSR